MGVYLNPGNSGFKRILETEFIDKTGLIHLINNTIGTVKNLTWVSLSFSQTTSDFCCWGESGMVKYNHKTETEKKK